MIMEQLKRRLNNYKWTDETINNLKENIINKNVPLKYTGFIINDNKLIYHPTNQEVVYKTDIENKIKEIYDEFGLGSGINNLYEKISRRYIGITRIKVIEFLKSQTNYQLGQSQHNQTNKKIFSTGINKTWYIDLIDLNMMSKYNRNFRYILTIVDSFSKFVILKALKEKTGKNLVKELTEVGTTYNYPKSIIQDNGPEFRNVDLKNFCEEKGIKQIFGRSYSPKSNSLAEASNGIIRNVLRFLFIKNQNLIWFNHLDEIMKSINDTAASSTMHPRSEIYLENKHQNEILEKNKKERNIDLKKTREEQLNIGDKVRISLIPLFASVRKSYKEGNQKNVILKITPDTYLVEKIIKSRSKFNKDRYKVKDSNGIILPQIFYYNELQKVNINSENINANIITKLNR